MAERKIESRAEIDERWIGEWMDYGFARLGEFLTIQARFEDYWQRREMMRNGEESGDQAAG